MAFAESLCDQDPIKPKKRSCGRNANVNTEELAVENGD